MSSNLKPITVWGRGGPNPPKVAILVRELGLPHELKALDFGEIKKPWYLEINPNGRMPAIQDPNKDVIVWESGAILEYLVEEYDQDHKLSFSRGTPEYYQAKQWLFFQVSGQGPYYGQYVWFRSYHPEKVPSAVDRYLKEIHRVTSVLESHLAQQKATAGRSGPWLVGGKYSYVDIAWATYQNILSENILSKEEYNRDDYPHVTAWLANVTAREAVAWVLEDNRQMYAKFNASKEAAK